MHHVSWTPKENRPFHCLAVAGWGGELQTQGHREERTWVVLRCGPLKKLLLPIGRWAGERGGRGGGVVWAGEAWWVVQHGT